MKDQAEYVETGVPDGVVTQTVLTSLLHMHVLTCTVLPIHPPILLLLQYMLPPPCTLCPDEARQYSVVHRPYRMSAGMDGRDGKENIVRKLGERQ